MSGEILLGLGNCVDYELQWDDGMMQRMLERHGPVEVGICPRIRTERELLGALLYHMGEGTGCEYAVNGAELIERFCAPFEKRVTLGGTSVRAAIAMAKAGVKSALHLGALHPSARPLIPALTEYALADPSEALYPHLIIQYPKGAELTAGGQRIRAPRSNRLIFVFDPINDALPLKPDFVRQFGPAKVLLISGFNTVKDFGTLTDRLITLKGMLKELPAEALVVYEDACFHRGDFAMEVNRELMGLVDIHGMNEDELTAYVGRPIALHEPEDVAAALQECGRKIAAKTLVVHTKSWALAYGERARDCERALRGGIVMAGARFMWGDRVTEAALRRAERWPLRADGLAFSRGIRHALGERVACLPSLALEEKNATTVGLGDAFVGGFLPALVGMWVV